MFVGLMKIKIIRRGLQNSFQSDLQAHLAYPIVGIKTRTDCSVDETVQRVTQEALKAAGFWPAKRLTASMPANPALHSSPLQSCKACCADRTREPYHTEYLLVRQQCRLAGGQRPPSKDLACLPGILCCTLAVAIPPHHFLDLAIPSQILPTMHLHFTEATLRAPRLWTNFPQPTIHL